MTTHDLNKEEFLTLNRMLNNEIEQLRECKRTLQKRIHDNEVNYQSSIRHYKKEYHHLVNTYNGIMKNSLGFGIEKGTQVFVFTLTPTTIKNILRGYFGTMHKETPTHIIIQVTNKHNNKQFKYVLRKTEITAVKSMYKDELVSHYDRVLTKDEVKDLVIHESCKKAEHAMRDAKVDMKNNITEK